MITHKKEGQIIYEGAGSKGVLLHAANQCEYVRLEIDAGARIDRHQLPLPVTFFVISGQGTLTTDSAPIIVNPGDLLEVPPNLPREWYNHGTEMLRLLVIKHGGPGSD